ncbi:MAG: hypothetical protein IJ629_02380 [Clostridia bacterium]|nr:hypothetical protein [Clostridia bacterium]
MFEKIRFPVGKVFEDVLTIPRVFEKASRVVLNDVAKYYYLQRAGSILHEQTQELKLAYINAAIEITEELRKIEPKLENYCDYSIAHIALKTYNDIGLFDMNDLLETEEIQRLYKRLVQIFDAKKVEEVLFQETSSVKKLHFYYLVLDKEGYLKNNKNLPELFPGWGKKE